MTTPKKPPAKKPAKKTARKAAKKATARKKRSTAKPAGPSLVVVESPAKARTIGRFLGKEYEVRASMGHVRDLPKKRLGIDMESGDFEPEYEVIPDKEKVVKELGKLAKKAPTVYLATDLDREGEAIAWHLVEALDVPEDRQARVTFHEITRRAIEQAFEHPGKLDPNRVDAQQARRLLDRMVGYPLSRLLSRSISRGLSGGRVQSVALRLISDREKQIRAFTSVEYWRVFADLRAPGAAEDEAFETDLVNVDGLDIERVEDAKVPEGTEEELLRAGRNGDEGAEPKATPRRRRPRELRLPTEAMAKDLLAELETADYAVESVEAKRRAESSPPPFITSTLQQQASIRLRWSTKRAMRIAQQLYEGLGVGSGGGRTGLITYMRTDSVSLAPEAVKQCRKYIGENFGADHLPEKARVFRSRKGAQEAHEAIRPTDVNRTPESVSHILDEDQLKLYRLIWQRFVACQMAPAQIDTTVLRVRAGRATFEARGRVVAFAGWRAVAPPRGKAGSAAPTLPRLAEGDALDLVKLRTDQRATQPPPRYTEATLVRRLEKEGIGRPSTYADIISKIQARKYVSKEAGRFHASELGEVVTDRMLPYFPGIMEVDFTRKLEEDLDAIESGKQDWRALLGRFHEQFDKELEVAKKEMAKKKFEPAEDEPPCDNCGKPMVVRFSRGEKFFGCSGYPECKFTRSPDRKNKAAPIPTDHVCEKCGKGMVIRDGRRGRFLSCVGYPECKNTKDIREDGTIVEVQKTGENCEKCGAEMIVKSGRRGPFAACSAFPECRNARDLGSAPGSGSSGDAADVPKVPLPECPKCGSAMSIRRSRRGAFCGCTKYPDCKGTAPVPEGALPPRKPAREAGVDCPECGKPMLIRSGRRGEFAGCSGYPSCRKTLPMEKLEEARKA